jgi:hypothetical protein
MTNSHAKALLERTGNERMGEDTTSGKANKRPRVEASCGRHINPPCKLRHLKAFSRASSIVSYSPAGAVRLGVPRKRIVYTMHIFVVYILHNKQMTKYSILPSLMAS